MAQTRGRVISALSADADFHRQALGAARHHDISNKPCRIFIKF